MFADAFPGSEPTIERVTVPSSFLKRDVPMLRVRTVSRAIGEKLCRWLGVSEDGSRSKTKTFEFPRVVTSSREMRSEEYTSELQSQSNLVCRLLLEKKKT